LSGKLDQSLPVVDEVGEADFDFRSGRADTPILRMNSLIVIGPFGAATIEASMT
jgi:hypothetical protein